MILPTWFDHVQESFSYKEVQLKNFCPPAKPSNIIVVLLLKFLAILFYKYQTLYFVPPSWIFQFSFINPFKNFSF